jgi:RNA polymerase sigma factor (sigma-70 family)
MSSALSSYIRRLSGRIGAGPARGLTDAQLLDRWLTLRDEAAFEVLLWRHGPMILGVCRRVLGNPADVEDAFQAAFLLLVRKASAIRQNDSVAGWLYRVAYRVALRSRQRAARRGAYQTEGVEQLPADDAPDELIAGELRGVLDDEIHRLPAKYRTPFIRCYLEGCSNEEVAVELSCPVGTIYSRLAVARERLRSRLERRGVTLPAAGITALLAHGVASAAIPPRVAEKTIQAAIAFASHSATAAGVSAGAVALAKGVSREMFVAKLKLGAAVVLALILCGGAGGFAFYGAAGAGYLPRGSSTTSTTSVLGAQPALAGAVQPVPVTRTIRVPSQVDGLLLGVFTEITPTNKIAPRDVVVIGKQRFRRLREGDKVKEGQLLARIDDALALDDVNIAEAKVTAAEAERRMSEAMREESKRRVALLDGLKTKVGVKDVSEADYAIARVNLERYTQEAKAKRATVAEVQGQLRRVKTQLKMHEIRSPADGVIKTIYFRKGEAVKRLETVMEILPSDDDK